MAKPLSCWAATEKEAAAADESPKWSRANPDGPGRSTSSGDGRREGESSRGQDESNQHSSARDLPAWQYSTRCGRSHMHACNSTLKGQSIESLDNPERRPIDCVDGGFPGHRWPGRNLQTSGIPPLCQSARKGNGVLGSACTRGRERGRARETSEREREREPATSATL